MRGGLTWAKAGGVVADARYRCGMARWRRGVAAGMGGDVPCTAAYGHDGEKAAGDAGGTAGMTGVAGMAGRRRNGRVAAGDACAAAAPACAHRRATARRDATRSRSRARAFPGCSMFKPKFLQIFELNPKNSKYKSCQTDLAEQLCQKKFGQIRFKF